MQAAVRIVRAKSTCPRACSSPLSRPGPWRKDEKQSYITSVFRSRIVVSKRAVSTTSSFPLTPKTKTKLTSYQKSIKRVYCNSLSINVHHCWEFELYHRHSYHHRTILYSLPYHCDHDDIRLVPIDKDSGTQSLPSRCCSCSSSCYRYYR